MTSNIETLAHNYSTIHKNACEIWTHGAAVKSWYDNSGNLCIKYEDNTWWHYSQKTGILNGGKSFVFQYVS